MNRPGAPPHHSSMCQSLYARVITCASSLSGQRANSSPVKPVIDAKQSEPSTPFAFMSSRRAFRFQQPRRIWPSAVGSMPYSSLGRPATALSPTFGICWFSKNQASEPSFLVRSRGALSFHFAGTWRSNMSGGSHTWSSTETRIMSFICMEASRRSAPQPEYLTDRQVGQLAKRVRGRGPGGVAAPVLDVLVCGAGGGVRAVRALPTTLAALATRLSGPPFVTAIPCAHRGRYRTCAATPSRPSCLWRRHAVDCHPPHFWKGGAQDVACISRATGDGRALLRRCGTRGDGRTAPRHESGPRQPSRERSERGR